MIRYRQDVGGKNFYEAKELVRAPGDDDYEVNNFVTLSL
jgi:hypothetical protein